MTDWKEMKSSEKPKELFRIAPDLYMQTRNAEQVTEGSGEEKSTGWVCEARTVTESELVLLERIAELESQANESNESTQSQIAELDSHATDTDLALAELAAMIGGE